MCSTAKGQRSSKQVKSASEVIMRNQMSITAANSFAAKANAALERREALRLKDCIGQETTRLPSAKRKTKTQRIFAVVKRYLFGNTVMG